MGAVPSARWAGQSADGVLQWCSHVPQATVSCCEIQNKVEVQAKVRWSTNSINKVRQEQVEETRNQIKTRTAINDQKALRSECELSVHIYYMRGSERERESVWDGSVL